MTHECYDVLNTGESSVFSIIFQADNTKNIKYPDRPI